MKQTAVEWLWRWINDNQEATIEQGNEAFEQAKAMEKEQLREAWNDGYKKAHQDIVTNSFSTFEQYQNEKNG
jgi:hypothetical protein